MVDLSPLIKLKNLEKLGITTDPSLLPQARFRLMKVSGALDMGLRHGKNTDMNTDEL